MRKRLRWLAGAMAAFVALAAFISFAPKPIPAVPPPVRLEGALDMTADPSQNELVIVPAPSVDLRGPIPAATTTTVAPAPPPAVDDNPSPEPASDDEIDEIDDIDDMDDSADSADTDDSIDGSADSSDD
jgi:hypothetical protein